MSACIATAGPGATNLITGIANAYAEQLPVLVITGETSTHIFGRGGMQESSGEGGAIDQCELFRGITRYRKLIERTDYLGQVLNQATTACSPSRRDRCCSASVQRSEGNWSTRTSSNRCTGRAKPRAVAHRAGGGAGAADPRRPAIR